MKKYRVTIQAWGRKWVETFTTDSLKTAIHLTRSVPYQGCCRGDMLTDIVEGRVPVIKTEVEIIDESKDTLDYIYVPVTMAGLHNTNKTY